MIFIDALIADIKKLNGHITKRLKEKNDKMRNHQWRKNISYKPPWEVVYVTMWLAANGLFKYHHITEEFDEFCAGCGKRKGGGFTIVNLPLNRYMAICDECTEKTKTLG